MNSNRFSDEPPLDAEVVNPYRSPAGYSPAPPAVPAKPKRKASWLPYAVTCFVLAVFTFFFTMGYLVPNFGTMNYFEGTPDHPNYDVAIGLFLWTGIFEGVLWLLFSLLYVIEKLRR